MTDKKENFLVKLDELESRFCEIEKQISDPEISCDHAKLISLSKEQGKLKTIVAKYRQFKHASEQIADTKQILSDKSSD